MYLSSNVALGFLVVISIITSQNIEMKNGINRYVNFDAWHLNILHVTRPISWTSCLTFRMNLVGGFWFGLRSVLVIVVWLGFQKFLSWCSGLLYTVWEFEYFVSFKELIVHEKGIGKPNEFGFKIYIVTYSIFRLEFETKFSIFSHCVRVILTLLFCQSSCSHFHCTFRKEENESVLWLQGKK